MKLASLNVTGHMDVRGESTILTTNLFPGLNADIKKWKNCRFSRKIFQSLIFRNAEIKFLSSFLVVVQDLLHNIWLSLVNIFV